MYHDGMVENLHQSVKSLEKRHDWCTKLEDKYLEVANSLAIVNQAFDEGLW